MTRDADAPPRYGLIAGNGRVPFMVLDSARSQGLDMVVAAIREETSPEIDSCGFPVHWLGVGQLGKLIRVFRKAGVRRAVMAGQVKHARIFGSSLPDLKMIRVLAGLKQKNTNALIGAIARVLEDEGIVLADSTELLKPHMAPEGALTARDLNRRERADLEFGLPIARRIAEMDIGLTVVVRDRIVIAVEAMEGTDETIRRAGRLVNNENLTVVKVSRPQQDMRFDVPVAGAPTIRTMVDAGATALVVDAGRTLLIDRAEMLELADRCGIAVVGLAQAQENRPKRPQ